MTIRECLLSWLSSRSGIRSRTAESYQSVIDLYISPSIGAVQVGQLTSSHVRTMLSRVSGRGLGRTAELCYVVCRSALADLPQRPMTGVERPAHVQRTPDAWSDDQIAVYLAALAEHPHGIALSFALLCGLRRGECVGLRWSDVFWDDCTVLVCNQRVRLASGQIVDGPPKSRAGVRTVPVPGPLMDRLRAARRPKGYIDGITPSGLDQAHRALVRRLGLPPIPLHGLRHSMATACIRHGGDMRSLQVVLGHASYTTTAMRYTHPDRAMLRAAVDAGAALCYNSVRV